MVIYLNKTQYFQPKFVILVDQF